MDDKMSANIVLKTIITQTHKINRNVCLPQYVQVDFKCFLTTL